MNNLVRFVFRMAYCVMFISSMNNSERFVFRMAYSVRFISGMNNFGELCL